MCGGGTCCVGEWGVVGGALCVEPHGGVCYLWKGTETDVTLVLTL
jgi:hypothetical protein